MHVGFLPRDSLQCAVLAVTEMPVSVCHSPVMCQNGEMYH